MKKLLFTIFLSKNKRCSQPKESVLSILEVFYLLGKQTDLVITLHK